MQTFKAVGYSVLEIKLKELLIIKQDLFYCTFHVIDFCLSSKMAPEISGELLIW